MLVDGVMLVPSDHFGVEWGVREATGYGAFYMVSGDDAVSACMRALHGKELAYVHHRSA